MESPTVQFENKTMSVFLIIALVCLAWLALLWPKQAAVKRTPTGTWRATWRKMNAKAKL